MDFITNLLLSSADLNYNNVTTTTCGLEEEPNSIATQIALGSLTALAILSVGKKFLCPNTFRRHAKKIAYC